MLVIEEPLPEKALIVEEPEIAKLISNFLNIKKSINRRGYLLYIGDFNGENIIISTHGVGGPSTALILDELIGNGVKIIIRYGTAGAINEKNLGKYFIPLGVSHHYYSSLYQRMRGDIILSLHPDLELAYGLYKLMKDNNREVFYGSLFQSDDFYSESHISSDDAIDMETGTIFLISRLRGVKAASLLILANFRGKWINYEEIYRRDSPLVLRFLSEYNGNIKL
ncbi:hypothetical protein [Saccharolobus caldissimus]|uniref:5'-methylthioadenosine phosphorylase n=1 Tax=Saccharolobus caldissimus TaxID=1702097 RepID=A0AAQ4CQW1_9CREN|nr:hypothetical protein [Saccharolobus caldissimus]BDB98192.1 5'-methylthioadenosine phosphorylase [Saccharolobus caldissimus]